MRQLMLHTAQRYNLNVAVGLAGVGSHYRWKILVPATDLHGDPFGHAELVPLLGDFAACEAHEINSTVIPHAIFKRTAMDILVAGDHTVTFLCASVIMLTGS